MNHIAKIVNENEFSDQVEILRSNIDRGVFKTTGTLKKLNVANIAQRYDFDSEIFTPDAAKAWLQKNEIRYVEFTEAQPEQKIGEPREIKVGARHSAEDYKTINTIHKMAHELMNHAIALGSTYVPNTEPDPLSAWEEDLKHTISEGT